MVLALRPDCLATSRNVTPRGDDSGDALFAIGGRARENTSSSERTRAERLSDFKNPRRDENKLTRTFPLKRVLNSGRFFYRQSCRRLQVLMRRRGKTMAHSRSTSLLNIWRKLCAAVAILAAAVMAAAAGAQTATAIHSRDGGLLIQRPARTWEFLCAVGRKSG